MTNVISALTARTQFGQIMRRAGEKSERFLVDKNGEASVVIMSVKDYLNTFNPGPNWLADIRSKAQVRGTDRVSLKQINSIISEVRSKEISA